MFNTGDIIEYCDELFEVESNYGSSGTVWELNYKLERTGVKISSFHWSAYGVDCKLFERV